jgi:hypothetical protein
MLENFEGNLIMQNVKVFCPKSLSHDDPTSPNYKHWQFELKTKEGLCRICGMRYPHNGPHFMQAHLKRDHDIEEQVP